MKSIRYFIQLSRPAHLLSAVLLFVLGTGVAHYLKGQTNWNSFYLGLIWIVLLLLGVQYLNEYFDPGRIGAENTWKRTPFTGSSGAIGEGKLSRQVALWAGLSCLTITASLTVLVIRDFGYGNIGILILGVIFVAVLFYAIPPFRLVSSGYGELIMSIVIAGLVPTLGFLFQSNEFHRLVLMVALPLTTLHIGMLMALEFPDYAADLKQGIRPLIVRIGWQKGMTLHNVLVLGSFILMGVAIAFGLPYAIGLPVFLVLPIAIFQVWMMNRIGDGAKPNWSLLVLVSISTFGLTAYLLTFAFWIH